MRISVPGRLGFGTAPLGNMYRNIPEQEALDTVEAAWQQGIRYFDAAPMYGAGLAEIRLGTALQQHRRDDYVLSTKVGRLILDEREDTTQRDLGEKGGLFEHGLPNKIVYDYTADGTLRAIEASLARLKTDRLDIVWIHDPARDFHGEGWRDVFDIAMNGAAKALTRLREEGVISAWGLGVNRVEPCEMALQQADPDGFLIAGRYTLLDHADALRALMPASTARGWASWWAARTTPASWPAARTTNTSRPRRRSWPAWTPCARCAPSSTWTSARPRCSSRWRIRPWRR